MYRRDEASMPGSRREVKNARDEGVRFIFNQQPLAIEGTAHVSGVRVRATAPNEAIEESFPADVVILAFGFRASPASWFDAQDIRVNEQGRVRVESALEYQTSNPKVFAGGDNVRGADLVVTAVRDGRDAAASINVFLTSK